MTFIACRAGHYHWGAHGAAGLLLVHHDKETRYCLVRRAGCHQSGYWSIPCGAIEASEAPVDTALREAREELGRFATPAPTDVIARNCGGGWFFTTVVVEMPAMPNLPQTGPEHDDLRWVTEAEAATLPLHPGLVLHEGAKP